MRCIGWTDWEEPTNGRSILSPDIECGGVVKVVACIEDPVVIQKILDHLKEKAETKDPNPLPESRAPPVGLQASLFD